MSFSYLDGNISLSDTFLEELWNERYGAEFAQEIDIFNYYLREITRLRDELISGPSEEIALLIISRYYFFLIHLDAFRAVLTSLPSYSVEKTNELNNWLSIVDGHYRVAYDAYKLMTTRVTIQMVHECLNKLNEINNEPESVANKTNLESSISFSELDTAIIPLIDCYGEASISESEYTTTFDNEHKDEINLDFVVTETSIINNFNVETSCMPSDASTVDKSDCLSLHSLCLNDQLESMKFSNCTDFNVILKSPPPIVYEPIIICNRSLSLEMLEEKQDVIEFPLTNFYDITPDLIHEVRVPPVIDKTSKFEIKSENEIYLHTDGNIFCLTYVDPFWENTMNSHYRDCTNVLRDFSLFFSPETCRLIVSISSPLKGQRKIVASLYFVRLPRGHKAMGVEMNDLLQNFRWDPGIFSCTYLLFF